MNNEIKIGGVTEHFNLPWNLAVEKGKFAEAGVDLNWKFFAGGTGVMTTVVARAFQQVDVVHGPKTSTGCGQRNSTEHPIHGYWVPSDAAAQEREPRLDRSSKPTFAQPTVGSLRKVLQLACQP